MKRIEFLKLSSLLFGGAFIPSRYINAEGLRTETSGLREIAPGTGIYSEKGGTIMWQIREGVISVVDSQFPESANNFLAQFKIKTKKKIDFLFNTHHHRDHVSGNAALRSRVKTIIAHENCVRLQKENFSPESGSKFIAADKTYKTEWKNGNIRLYYLGNAHTGGDSIVHYTNVDIAHLGDLVFNKVYPFIDAKGGGSIKEWIVTLEKVEKKFGKGTRFVFGHGATPEDLTGGMDAVTEMRRYLSALLDYAKMIMEQGRVLTDASAVKFIPGAAERKPMWDGALKMNIETAYKEVSAG